MSLLLNRAQKWAFIHIPKTGGTSVSNVLSKLPNTEILHSHDSLRVLDDVSDYFIFTIVRNPYTRLQSAYQHGIRKKVYSADFSTFLENANDSDIWLMPQEYFVNAGKNRERKISFIGRYENFKKDLSYILTKLGIENKKIPHLNRNPIYDLHPNLKQENYYKFFYKEDWMVDWVRERYKNDFKIFNYGMDLPR